MKHQQRKRPGAFWVLKRNIWNALALTLIHLARGWIDRASPACVRPRNWEETLGWIETCIIIQPSSWDITWEVILKTVTEAVSKVWCLWKMEVIVWFCCAVCKGSRIRHMKRILKNEKPCRINYITITLKQLHATVQGLKLGYSFLMRQPPLVFWTCST